MPKFFLTDFQQINVAKNLQYDVSPLGFCNEFLISSK
jgi:hypothetical protein